MIRPKGDQFQADFMHSGRRFRRSFSSRDAAEAWELRSRANLLEGRPVDEGRGAIVGGPAPVRIADFVQHVRKVWWDKKGRRSAVTLTRNAELFAEFIGPSTPVAAALTHAQIDRYTEYMATRRHNSNETINRHLASIRVVLRIAKKEGKIPELFTLESHARNAARERVLSVAEEKTLLDYLDKAGRAMEKVYVVFLLDTGARRGEAHALTWSNVDVTAGKVTFRAATTKSGKTRSVWLSDRVVAALEGLRRDPEAGAHDTVFGALRYFGFSAWWQGMKQRFDFLSDVNIHDFRHTCATRLAASGFDAYRLKAWMGHSSIVTSERYVNLTIDNLRSGRDIINSFGGGDALRPAPVLPRPEAGARGPARDVLPDHVREPCAV